MTTLSIVYVMFNEFDLIQKSLASVYNEKIINAEIIIIDNSTDKDGYKKVLKKFPKVKYFQNKLDLGFAKAVNIGIKKAKGEYILVIFPDMYVLPGTIIKTLKYIIINPQVGLLGCKAYSRKSVSELSVYKRYPNLLTQLFYFNMPLYKLLNRFFPDFHPTFYTKEEHQKIIHSAILSGVYHLARKKALSDVGFYDEDFFYAFEDLDLCMKMKKKGWDIVYLPVGGIVQNGIGDWKKTRISQSMPIYLESQYKFFRKNYGKTYTIIAWLVALVSSAVTIPYLFLVSNLKTIFNINSQSTELLPLWIKILKWHLFSGLKATFS